MNSNEKSILEMAKGTILERTDYEMSKIIENILDVNTNPTKKRTLTITVSMQPSSDRQQIGIEVVAKSKLEPTLPIHTNLYVAENQNGKVVAVEMLPQIPGQQDIYGEEQEESKTLRMIKYEEKDVV